jgi:hypothetical protein
MTAEQRFHRLTTPPTGQTAIDLVRRFAAHDLAIFAEYVIEDERRLGCIVLAPMHSAIVSHTRFSWEHGHRAINLAPPGSGKTSLLLGILAFVLGNDPTLRAKLASASRAAADERVDVVARVVAHNPRFAAVFPGCRPGEQWSEGRIVLERPGNIRDASLQGYGATSKTMGMRADVIGLDDLDDDDTAHSARRRDKTGRGFYEKFLSRGERSTRLVSICTRWHDADIVGVLLGEESQRQLYSFLWIRSIIAGDLRGRAMICETLMPGDHQHLRFAFVHGFGWAPVKRDFLRRLRDAA